MGWSELIGAQLGKYQIEAEIARGGMSRVYQAHHIETNEPAAIKVMALGSDGGDHNTFVRRFEHEAQAVEMLDHPHIVKVFDAGRSDDFVYIAMQLVLGGTFRQYLGRQLPVADACYQMSQMARALHHAHMQGVIHRDVKPANMLISKDDPTHLLLADFGIAKIMGQKGVTKTGTAVGTPEYMAPEQAKGEEIDPRADIYGLACVLYEALAGRPPFVGPTALSICYQHVHTRPAYIRGFNPEVPRALALVIEQALAKNPRDRFPTADAFASALHSFTEPNGAIVRRPSTPLNQPLVNYAPERQFADMPTPYDASYASTRSPSSPLRMPQMDADKAFGITGPILDLSTLQPAKAIGAAPIVQDDTTRQTQEMMPMATPANRRHTRPVQPNINIKSRTATAPRLSGRSPGDTNPDVTDHSTIENPIMSPPPPPSHLLQGNHPQRRPMVILLTIGAILGLLVVLVITQVNGRGGSSPSTKPVGTLNTTTPASTATTQLQPTTTLAVPTATTVPSTTTTTVPVVLPIQSATTAASIDRSCSINTQHFAAGSPVDVNVKVNDGFGAGNITAVFNLNGTSVSSRRVIPVYSAGCYEIPYYGQNGGTVPAVGSYTVQILWNDVLQLTTSFVVG